MIRSMAVRTFNCLNALVRRVPDLKLAGLGVVDNNGVASASGVCQYCTSRDVHACEADDAYSTMAESVEYGTSDICRGGVSSAIRAVSLACSAVCRPDVSYERSEGFATLAPASAI